MLRKILKIPIPVINIILLNLSDEDIKNSLQSYLISNDSIRFYKNFYKKEINNQENFYLHSAGRFILIKDFDDCFFQQACLSNSLTLVKTLLKVGISNKDKKIKKVLRQSSKYDKFVSTRLSDKFVEVFATPKNLEKIETFKKNCSDEYQINKLKIKYSMPDLDIIIYEEILEKYYSIKIKNSEILEFLKKTEKESESGLYKACLSRNFQEISDIFKKEKNPNYNQGLYASCIKKDFELIRLMIKQGAKDYEQALKLSLKRGSHLKIIIYLLKFLKDQTNKLNKILMFSLQPNLRITYEVTNLIIKSGANCFEKAFIYCCKINNVDKFEYFLKSHISLNKALFLICENGFFNSLYLFYNKNPTNILECKELLEKKSYLKSLENIYTKSLKIFIKKFNC